MKRRLWLCFLAGIAIATFFRFVERAFPKDDGRFANSPLKSWFDSLANKNGGLCCSFADGVSVQDVDWDTLGPTTDDQSGYRVRLNGVWLNVPKTAVVEQPNKFGPAVVWPYQDTNGVTQIRCFIPGSGA